jgi:hypothetical protein
LENDSPFLTGKNGHKPRANPNYKTQASGEDIEDGTMIQFMANENMQEWGHSMAVIDETVKVTKEYLELDTNFVRKKLRTLERKNNIISANAYIR